MLQLTQAGGYLCSACLDASHDVHLPFRRDAGYCAGCGCYAERAKPPRTRSISLASDFDLKPVRGKNGRVWVGEG